MSAANLQHVLRRATALEMAEGTVAYRKYHALTFEIAKRHGCDGVIGAAVFAALSPNNDYHGNLRDANRLLHAAVSGLDIDGFSVSTYGANKRKAWEIAHGADPHELIAGNKTRSFFLNIVDPEDPFPVTIDGHMLNVWNGKRLMLQSAKMYRGMYSVIAHDMRAVARVEGLVPNQAQAIIWYTWRRLHGIKTSVQLELWDREYAVAGLGWR